MFGKLIGHIEKATGHDLDGDGDNSGSHHPIKSSGAARGLLSFAAQQKPVGGGGSRSFSDDFNRPDSTNLGGGWLEQQGNWWIRGGKLVCGPSQSEHNAWSPAPSAANYSIEVTLRWLAPTRPGRIGRHGGIFFASDKPGNRLNDNCNGYQFSWIDRAVDPGLSLVKWTNGKAKSLGRSTGVSTSTPPRVWKVEVQGGTIRCYADGVKCIEVSDMTHRGEFNGLWAWNGEGQAIAFDDYILLDLDATAGGTRAAPGGAPGFGFDLSHLTGLVSGMAPAQRDQQVEQVASEMDDGHSIPLSTCDGNKKSLFIGINYPGTSAALRGCHNDVLNLKPWVESEWGFPSDSEHQLILMDDGKHKEPTRANILAAFRWLESGAKAGDSLFMHYSGHGGKQADSSPDSDETDGQDETLVPSDYQRAGQITDDELHETLVRNLPSGVRLTAVIDACHSGSVFDLPYTYQLDGENHVVEIDNRKEAMKSAVAAGMSLFQGDKGGALKHAMAAGKFFLASKKNPTTTVSSGGSGGNSSHVAQKAVAIRSTVADVIQFSGCRDDQTSADAHMEGAFTGAMSWGLMKAFNEHGHTQNYTTLLGNLRANLMGKFSQVPQMSTGHKMDMKNANFKM